MADDIPVKMTWFELLDSQNYRLNGVPFDSVLNDAVTQTGFQPVFATGGPFVWDPTAAAAVKYITSTGQATANAFTKAPAVQTSLTNTGVAATTYALWLRAGYDSEPGNLVPGSSASGMSWTAPGGSEGMYSITAALECSGGVGVLVGQNYSLAVLQNTFPICHSTGLCTGTGLDLHERAACSTQAYIKAGEVIKLEIGAGYTNNQFDIFNVILTLTKISGPIAGVA
jgi:hypothetical protein